MPTLKLTLDDESYCRLADAAVRERRPLAMQAEVFLLEAQRRWPIPQLPASAEVVPLVMAEPTS